MQRQMRLFESAGLAIATAVTVAACFGSSTQPPAADSGSPDDASVVADVNVPSEHLDAAGNQIDSSVVVDTGAPPADAGPVSEAASPGVSEAGVDAGAACPGSSGCSCGGGGPGVSNCGPGGNESCCASVLVTGGTFYRTYGSGNADPATVSSFQLDKYEVTVGRFRQFIAAADAPWAPPGGSGIHTHVNGGKGLVMAGPPDAGPVEYELGWLAANDGIFPEQISTWHAQLDRPGQTWTDTPSTNENLPINNVPWFDAYAFCIYDGGFLPSEAEWTYAAAGGSEQRPYPWGATVPGPNTNLAIYNCYYDQSDAACGPLNIAPVGSVPAGNGKYGNADLAGNVAEYTYDLYDPTYGNPCNDCAYLTPGYYRSVHGGSFESPATALVAAARIEAQYQTNYPDVGFRCAHAP
jgi:sulfatase modifying factor 1